MYVEVTLREIVKRSRAINLAPNRLVGLIRSLVVCYRGWLITVLICTKSPGLKSITQVLLLRGVARQIDGSVSELPGFLRGTKAPFGDC